MPDIVHTLITGASTGIGLEIARRLAQRGELLVITARSGPTLEEVAVELRRLGSPEVTVLPADLATPSGAGALLEQLGARGLTIGTLVNNAGFGAIGAFATLGETEQLDMVQLNVTSLVHLTRRLLPDMVARGHGHVLNVASVAGFQPGPGMATYYATKAFVVSFSEAIGRELRGSGVTVTTLCPGPTATPFVQRARMTSTLLFRPGNVMTAGEVADAAVRAIGRGGLVVPGFMNKLLIQSQRISPRAMVLGITSRLNQGRAG
jgi:short-subunit dehydrogenase